MGGRSPKKTFQKETMPVFVAGHKVVSLINAAGYHKTRPVAPIKIMETISDAYA